MKRAMLTVLLSACATLNIEVKGQTQQLLGDEVPEFQKMKRHEPADLSERCHSWAVLVEDVTAPTPTLVPGVTETRSPRMQAVVTDERDRACALGRPAPL